MPMQFRLSMHSIKSDFTHRRVENAKYVRGSTDCTLHARRAADEIEKAQISQDARRASGAFARSAAISSFGPTLAAHSLIYFARARSFPGGICRRTHAQTTREATFVRHKFLQRFEKRISHSLRKASVPEDAPLKTAFALNQ